MANGLHKILLIDLIEKDFPKQFSLYFKNKQFEVMQHSIGWDFPLAMALIRQFDGSVDAIVLGGLIISAKSQKVNALNREAASILKAVKKSRCYTSEHLRGLYSEWTIRKLLKENPNFFLGQRTLFHCALASRLGSLVKEAGGNIAAADVLLTTGIPFLISGLKNLRRFTRSLHPLFEFVVRLKHGSTAGRNDPKIQLYIRKWIFHSDIFITFQALLNQVGSYDVLEGKTVIIDFLTEDQHAALKQAGVARFLELCPNIPQFANLPTQSFALQHAVIDLLRLDDKSDFDFDEYLLGFIDEYKVKVSKIEISSSPVRRCGFIIHPLGFDHFSNEPKLQWMKNIPKFGQNLIEKGMSHIPGIRYGQITGIKSILTKQEVICDLYALPATPRQLLAMDTDFVYNHLINLAERAKRDGCAMLGLGAYTKIVGDAGITVAKRASIPVTNGNSYSAAATLWSAWDMVKQLGFITTVHSVGVLECKAMVVGATGGIGRISALMLAVQVTELVLVAPRPEKLVLLKEEILLCNPALKVHIVTSTKDHLTNADLIVTATSNQKGSVLDVMKLKPGAVVCDCSRPLNISKDLAVKRPDVLFVESGEITLPGEITISCDIGLPKPSVYACLAETVLLTLEERYESFSLGRDLSIEKVRLIHEIGLRHGMSLSAPSGPLGVILESDIDKIRELATNARKSRGRMATDI